jgi:hypothetical protein
MLRIQAHDFGVWTQQRISNSRFSLLNQWTRIGVQ